jgi:shikimate dehydrogenase
VSEIAALGIIGDPVAHSLSPVMHNAALRALAIAAEYALWPTSAADLPARIGGLRQAGMLGANVTLPHKVAVVPLLDRCVAVAQTLGAVNTIVREADGSLTGYNTDAPAFYDSLAALAVDFPATRAVVLGAGGAARAALWALRQGGCQQISVVNRTRSHAAALIQGGEIALDAADPQVAACVRSSSLLINTTTLGWKPSDPAPLDLALLHPGLLAYDMVYRQTPLLQAAERCGARTSDGLEMLVRQAGLAFTLWFNREAPLDLMRNAARAALQA